LELETSGSVELEPVGYALRTSRRRF